MWQPAAKEARTEQLLDGWKAIAEYLNRTERTVQRWEKSKGLPVRRLEADSGEEQPRVFAYKSEIDEWWKQHETPLKQETEDESEERKDVIPVAAVPEVGRISRRPSRKAQLLVALIFLLLVAAASWRRVENWLVTPQVKMLGVMPFKNLSGAGDPEPQQLAEALTEEMISGLGRLHPKRLGVVELAPSAAGNSTLDYLLEGTVRRAGNKVAITAQLVWAKDQTRVWGDSYERDLQGPQDMIPLEIEIRDAITNEVLPLLPQDERGPQQVNREAYEAYLYGRFFWNKRTTEDLFKAITYFKKAIDSDPAYAPAYAGLADCYFLLGSVPYNALRPDDAFPESEAAAHKALQLDSSLAEAHVSLGYVALAYRRDFAEAERQFQSALKLRPEYATAHQYYGYYLTSMGRLDEAVKQREAARDLDPLSPIMNTALGEAYYQARQFDRSMLQNQKSLELDPGYSVALMNIARCYEQEHKYKEASQILQRILAIAPNEPAVVAMMAHEEALSGDRPGALKMAMRLEHMAREKYVSPIYFALVQIGLGNKDLAFEWLQKAYDEHCEYVVYLPSEPLADPLRSDPRFAALLKHMGLSR